MNKVKAKIKVLIECEVIATLNEDKDGCLTIDSIDKFLNRTDNVDEDFDVIEYVD